MRVTLQLPWPSSEVGVADGRVQAEPFDLKWLIAAVKRSPVAFSWNVWISAGRLRVSMKSGSSDESRIS